MTTVRQSTTYDDRRVKTALWNTAMVINSQRISKENSLEDEKREEGGYCACLINGISVSACGSLHHFSSRLIS